ncbi:MAG TPA: hypothetical protein VGR35_14470 [Tepidisphaeraceae bacterium]|nr:hypothetical protein [Tepidisphaeraceae bacterium]
MLSSTFHPLLSTVSSPPLSYTPFLTPLPMWEYWPVLLFPLCAIVAIVYKSIKCSKMEQVPREATALFIWILLGMAAAAAILAGIVKVMERV